jgi:seryl-tRNA synthetase
MTETEELEQSIIKKRDTILANMGNIVHDSVPISQDEARGSWWYTISISWRKTCNAVVTCVCVS